MISVPLYDKRLFEILYWDVVRVRSCSMGWISTSSEREREEGISPGVAKYTVRQGNYVIKWICVPAAWLSTIPASSGQDWLAHLMSSFYVEQSVDCCVQLLSDLVGLGCFIVVDEVNTYFRGACFSFSLFFIFPDKNSIRIDFVLWEGYDWRRIN